MTAPSILQIPACCGDEKWEPVPDWPHEASSCGQVRSIDVLGPDGVWRLGQLLPLHPDKRKGKGYLYADLADGKRHRRAHVAVLVLEAHRGLKPSPDHEASHLNDLRTDNHLVNLVWETKAANLARMWLRRRAARAVTSDPRDVTDGPFSQRDGDPRIPRYGVTGDGFHGTVRFPFHPSLPYFFHFVKSSLRSLRSLRDRRRTS